MVNNPFRGKSNLSIQKDTEDWGKNKFKPKKYEGKGKKGNFKNKGGFKSKFDNRKGNFKNNKEISKFNQVDRDARPENATPWNKFKDEIVFKQREDEHTAKQANMDSEEGKKVLKQREMNYRKQLIELKKQEPTQWDDFGEVEDKEKKSKFKNGPKDLNVKSKQFKKNNSNFNKTEVADNKNNQSKSEVGNGPKDLNAKSKQAFKKNKKKSKQIFKKNNSNTELQTEVKALISKELLDNFDSKNLDYKQKDKLRSIITKTTTMSFGNNFKQTVTDMKYQHQKKTLNKNQQK